MTSINLDNIRKLRKENRLSQGKMALVLGMNSLYPYHRKESGKQAFTAEELIVLSRFFNVNIEYFFEEQVAKNAINDKGVI